MAFGMDILEDAWSGRVQLNPHSARPGHIRATLAPRHGSHGGRLSVRFFPEVDGSNRIPSGLGTFAQLREPYIRLRHKAAKALNVYNPVIGSNGLVTKAHLHYHLTPFTEPQLVLDAISLS
jgi:hypothetical protein